MADLLTNLTMAAGAAGGENLYIEDVFSTYLYTGTGAAQTITNDIDLDGEGGLVWIKSRSAATNHFLFDTERGVLDELNSNTTDAEASLANSLAAFNSNGFSISSATGIGVSAATYASWTFRKAEKFFDVVTFTSTNIANQRVSHNLGSVPGMIIVKRTNAAGSWFVYHRSEGRGKYLNLNVTNASATEANFWGTSDPTSTDFGLATNIISSSGDTLVAYLFAHDAGGFGDDGEQNVITCGSFTTDGSGNATVTLGYEPQLGIAKASSGTSTWVIIDNMRGMTTAGIANAQLFPNTSAAEASGGGYFNTTSTGFTFTGGGSSVTWIYIAIRRGPMKTPTAGTEVFAMDTRGGTAPSPPNFTSGFVIDAALRYFTSGGGHNFSSRLTGVGYLETPETSAEVTNDTNWKWDYMNGFYNGSSVSATQLALMFRRAPGFFDVVCYTGTGSARNQAHNLGVTPELMFVKRRSASNAWAVYAGDNTDYLVLNTTAATADDNTYWNDTSPTSTVFSVGTNNATNASASTYVAYLFATLAGVSKVGSYTGNGSSVTVTTGFQPRFILVKRTDSTGNWIVGDSARGLVAGNDPALFLNSTAAETTGQDWVDISATGFTVNETALNANVSTATYIYLAIS